jgi:hypothetical protein
MSNILFNTDEEEKNFYDVKAHQKLINLDKAREDLDSDIDSILKKSGDLFSKYNARVNFLSEIYNLDLQIDKIKEEAEQ